MRACVCTVVIWIACEIHKYCRVQKVDGFFREVAEGLMNKVGLIALVSKARASFVYKYIIVEGARGTFAHLPRHDVAARGKVQETVYH